jgi:cardiolipin synthase A/B
LGNGVSPFPLTGGNLVEPLPGGDAAYPAMLEAIGSARRHVVLSSYIFDNDPVGVLFADALIEAHRRGVEVRVLIDAVGARYSRPPSSGHCGRRGRPRLFLGGISAFGCPMPISGTTARSWSSTARPASPAA